MLDPVVPDADLVVPDVHLVVPDADLVVQTFLFPRTMWETASGLLGRNGCASCHPPTPNQSNARQINSDTYNACNKMNKC